MILEIVATIATIAVICSYGYMVKTENANQYNTVNVVAAIPLIAVSVSHGAYQPAILSAFYLLIGLYGIRKAWKETSEVKDGLA